MKRSAIDVIVVGLHLRWKGVRQRPNHILSRLARRVPVIILEEPIAATAAFETLSTVEGITIVTPRRTSDLAEVTDIAAIRTVVELTGHRSALVWLYTPMMIELANAFPGAPLVFDKMDELSAFVGADPLMLGLETMVLDRADFVFAGGRSLYRSVVDRTLRARCYPSGVDIEHFARATGVEKHLKLRPFAHRRVFGYIGVIDERIDLTLIAQIADARPDAVVVMVGPVVKIAAETLPRRANIVYLGTADYEELPSLLAGFDVALMPFALNAHTERISPTKTLEYLAAGKPVVSTAVPDVVEDFQNVVSIARDANAFVRALDEIERSDGERATRPTRATEKIREASWDAIVDAMLIDLAANGIELTAPRR